LQPGGNVDPIPKDIPIALHDVAGMNADAHVNLLSGFLPVIVCPELCLKVLGALDRLHDRGKIDQEGIPYGFDNRAMMFCDRLADELIVNIQQAQHTSFVAAHLADEAHDIGKHDRGQPPMLCGSRPGAVLWHGGDYRIGGL
jgi:hypothetical protein